MKFALKGPIFNKSALVQVMALCATGDNFCDLTVCWSTYPTFYRALEHSQIALNYDHMWSQLIIISSNWFIIKPFNRVSQHLPLEWRITGKSHGKSTCHRHQVQNVNTSMLWHHNDMLECHITKSRIKRKTAITPLLTHWSYCSLAPSDRNVILATSVPPAPNVSYHIPYAARAVIVNTTAHKV